jgi:hypothetical protein
MSTGCTFLENAYFGNGGLTIGQESGTLNIALMTNSNKDIITFENDNDVELIETTNLDDIVKYDISNYTIYNGKIYYLLFTEDFLRQKKGISLTHNEALPLIDAFEKAIILHNKKSDEFWN